MDGGKDVAQLAEQHKLSDSTIYQSVRQHKVDMGSGPSGALTTDEKVESTQLRRENRELKRERDFLRRAATYFAREQQ